jgi:hypothetical protein
MSMTTSPQSVSRLYRICGILDVSQPHEPPRPVIGIALPLPYSDIPSVFISSQPPYWCVNIFPASLIIFKLTRAARPEADLSQSF